jgi:hypothetical protein
LHRQAEIQVGQSGRPRALEEGALRQLLVHELDDARDCPLYGR